MRCCFSVGVITLLFLAPLQAFQGNKRAALPSKEAQAKIENLIFNELYKDDYAQASKDPLAKARLAITLLQEGRDTRDDLTGRYVLFVEARDLAAGASDAVTALQAIDELAYSFDFSPTQIFQMKVQTLAKASKGISHAEGYQTVVDKALLLLEETLEADDYPTSLELLATAENAAKKLRSVSLVSSIRKKQEDLAALQKEYAVWKPFADVLAKNPADPKANLEMGRYHAFLKGHWERGLPLLARGSDANLKNLAALDLKEDADRTSVKVRLKLAEGWAAVKAPAGMKNHLLLRSYYWYQQSLGDLQGPQLLQVDKAMESIWKQLPPDYRPGEIAVELKRLEGHRGPVFASAFSPDGKRAISAGGDGSLRLWDLKSGKETRQLPGHQGRVWTVAFAEDGRHVLSGGLDNTIRLWDLNRGQEIRRFTTADYVRSVAISQDGKLALSGGDDRLVHLWNLETGQEIRSFPGHDHYVWSVALSRDGTRALSASLDKTIRLWDVKSGKELQVLSGPRGHKDTVLSVVFSPDGRHALSGSTDKTLKLWDLQTGQAIKTFTGHKGYVHGVAISPDGRRALSAGQDKTLRLWDIETGEELRTLETHQGQVWHVAFSSDGRLALSCGQDQTVRLWAGTR